MVCSTEMFTKIIAYNWKKDHVTDKHTIILKMMKETASFQVVFRSSSDSTELQVVK